MLDSAQIETEVYNHETGERFKGKIGALVLTDIPEHLRDEWEPQTETYVSFDFWTNDGEDVSTFMMTPDQARKLAVELLSKVNRMKVVK